MRNFLKRKSTHVIFHLKRHGCIPMHSYVGVVRLVNPIFMRGDRVMLILLLKVVAMVTGRPVAIAGPTGRQCAGPAIRQCRTGHK